MRMIQIPVPLPQPGAMARQPKPARPAPVPGRRRAIWSALHLLGSGLFLLAMITLLAQAHPDRAPSLTGPGAAASPTPERPLPSDPNKF